MTPSRIPRRIRRGVMVLSLTASDGLAVLAAGLVASLVRFGTVSAEVSVENTAVQLTFGQLSLMAVPLWLGSMALAGLYDLSRRSIGPSEVGRISRALSLGLVALILIAYAAKLPGLSRAWSILTLVFAIAFVVSVRGMLYLLLTLLRRRGYLLKSTLIVGDNFEAVELVRVVRSNRDSGLCVIGYVTSGGEVETVGELWPDDIPMLGQASDLRRVVIDSQVDSVIIASSAFSHNEVALFIATLRDLEIGLHVSSGLFEVMTSRVVISEISGIPLVTVRGLRHLGPSLALKRALDVVFAVLCILVGLPLWLVVASAIYLTDGGPVLYWQTRIGLDGKPFRMAKFRSMYVDADKRLEGLRDANEASGPLFKMKQDPRITPVGKWIRKFSIDEFPQLLNVVAGEMSVVGPRPPLPVEVDQYGKDEMRRLSVLPGITGLWQVSGRSDLTFDEMMRLDLFYIENWSLALDLSIVLRTIPAVILAHGAY